MDNSLKFSDWLRLNEGSGKRTRSSHGMYPPLYTQYYNYPPAAIATWGPDFLFYMDPEDLLPKVVDNPIFAKIVRKTIGPYGKAGASSAGD